MALKVNTAIKRPGIFMVAPIGSIDGAGYAIFQDSVTSVLNQNPDVILFDMEHADYINSMGIRVLVKAKKAMKQRGGKIVFTNLQPQINYKVFVHYHTAIFFQFFSFGQEDNLAFQSGHDIAVA